MMSHRHELGQGFNIAYMEEYVWCVHCKKRWSKEEITRMVNAIEHLYAKDAEFYADISEGIVKGPLPIKGAFELRNYAKTLRDEE